MSYESQDNLRPAWVGIGRGTAPLLGFSWNSKMAGKVTFSKFHVACLVHAAYSGRVYLNPALTGSTFMMPDFIWDPVFNKMGCGLAACISALPIMHGWGQPDFWLSRTELMLMTYKCSHISFGGCFMSLVRHWPHGSWEAPPVSLKVREMVAQITWDCSCASAALWFVQLEQLSRWRPSKNNCKNK